MPMALVLPHHGSPRPFPPEGHSLTPGHSSLGLSMRPPLTPPGLGRESSLLVLGDPQVGFVPHTHTHTRCYSPSAPLHPPKPSASCPAPNDGHSEMPGPCVPLWYLRTPWGQTLHPPVWTHGYSELPPRQGLRSPRPKGRTSEGLSICGRGSRSGQPTPSDHTSWATGPGRRLESAFLQIWQFWEI